MAGFLSLITGNLFRTVAGALAIALVGLWLTYSWKLHTAELGEANAKALAATAQLNVSILTGNLNELDHALKDANAHLLALQAEGDAKTAEANKRILELQGVATRASARSAKLLATPQATDRPVAQQSNNLILDAIQ